MQKYKIGGKITREGPVLIGFPQISIPNPQYKLAPIKYKSTHTICEFMLCYGVGFIIF